jgi:hypothetical protein
MSAPSSGSANAEPHEADEPPCHPFFLAETAEEKWAALNLSLDGWPAKVQLYIIYMREVGQPAADKFEREVRAPIRARWRQERLEAEKEAGELEAEKVEAREGGVNVCFAVLFNHFLTCCFW